MTTEYTDNTDEIAKNFSILSPFRSSAFSAHSVVSVFGCFEVDYRAVKVELLDCILLFNPAS